MKSGSGSSSSLLRILGAVGAIAAIVFLTLQQANFLLSRAMLIAFGDSESTYRSAWFEWDGDVVAKDVVIYPYNLGEDVTIRFERVHLETPGWFWFVRNTFDRKLKTAKLDRIHLTLQGGSSDTGFDPSLGDLGPFGLDTASPFEAEGCASDGMWVREELVQMGLDPEPPVLEFDYRVDGATLLTTVALEARGASRVQLERSAQLPVRVNALLVDHYPHLVQSERWTVQDQGFVQARNRHCAKKDGIDEAAFLARHAATVTRVLAMSGIAVDAASQEAYLKFARRGGQLTFGGSYAPPISSDVFYDLRDAGEAWPRMRDATLAHDQRQVAVAWQQFEPRPLEGLDEADSTWAAMRRERPIEATAANAADPSAPSSAMAAANGVPANAAGIAGASIAATAADARSVSATHAAPGPSAVALATPGSPTPASAGPATSPPAGSATPPPAGPAHAIAPGAAANAVAAAGTATPSALPGSAPADAAPAAGDTRAPLITAAAPPARIDSSLAWKDLSAFEGQRVRLWTRRNPPRLVTVLSVQGDELRISTRLGGGNAEYTVLRESFVRARALQ